MNKKIEIKFHKKMLKIKKKRRENKGTTFLQTIKAF